VGKRREGPERSGSDFLRSVVQLIKIQFNDLQNEFVSYEDQAGLISKCTGNLLLYHPESYPVLFLIRIYLPSNIQCLEKLQAQLCFESRLPESQTPHHVSAI
jgi:hypothetical protein